MHIYNQQVSGLPTPIKVHKSAPPHPCFIDKNTNIYYPLPIHFLLLLQECYHQQLCGRWVVSPPLIERRIIHKYCEQCWVKIIVLLLWFSCDGEVWIGSQSCMVYFTSDNTVSRRHFNIMQKYFRWLVECCGSDCK